MAGPSSGSHSAAALEEGAEMSERLNQMRAVECLEDFYGVDGDGLGQGEAACEEDLERVQEARVLTKFFTLSHSQPFGRGVGRQAQSVRAAKKQS